ncbi:MAG: UDP-N-acetylmuramoyl-L-alanyl-D-glutamate--2,6-diaminopimelate ligase [Chloroflexota bacterium]|nr:UDP-N-acetylmuramoyl-L-alanyl-D-glutamate--2,6-diaminopimelate ligase [Chloroflexota bacterium]
MLLKHLIQALPTVLGQIGGDVEIHSIAADSRQVQPGNLFVAIPGFSVDGHRFIAQAVAEGAVAVVGERPPQELFAPWGAFTYVRVPDAREAWGWLCAAWRDFPSRKLTLIGVTGTDGKTTTTNLVYHILRAAGLNAGMVSTVNARIGDQEIDTGLHTTTPDPPDVQTYLAQMVEAGATHAVLEVTSHGLAQRRVAGCDFDVVAVTNITHEHLDFHGSLEAYQRAKARLFKGLTRSFRKDLRLPDLRFGEVAVPKVAVLNRDDDSFRYLRPIPADRQIVYGMGGEADVTARDVRFAPDATRFTLHTPAGETAIETSLVGAFNVSNVLAAAGVGAALDLPPQVIAEGIAAVRGIPGRMERIEAGQDFLAIVDFAHTPNALWRALEAARGMIEGNGRVIVVFGCAGLRDREKRTMMGRIAGELADLVVITAEDPRTESLDEIMAQSAAAAVEKGKREGMNLWRIADRGEAILFACQKAHARDMVIACGKGHEQSMCFGATEYPWDDREAMRRALRGETLDTLPTAKIGSRK